MSTLISRLLGRVNYRPVEETFDLKWSNRFSFTFKPTITEAVVQTLPSNERGGVVIFSTNINATAGPGILNFAKAWFESLLNRFNRVRKIDRVMKEKNISGFTLGNYFTGRYKSAKGALYNEKSLTLEVLMISKEQLIDLATALCKEFSQESVLVKSFSDGEVYFVDGS